MLGCSVSFMTSQSGFRPTGRDACASAKQPGPLRGWISMQGALRACWLHQWLTCEFIAAGVDSVDLVHGPQQGAVGYVYIHTLIGKEPLEVMTCLMNRKVYMGCQLLLEQWLMAGWLLNELEKWRSFAIFQHGTLIWVISLPVVADCVAGFLHLELQSTLSSGTACFGFPRCCRDSR